MFLTKDFLGLLWILLFSVPRLQGMADPYRSCNLRSLRLYFVSNLVYTLYLSKYGGKVMELCRFYVVFSRWKWLISTHIKLNWLSYYFRNTFYILLKI